MSLISIPSNRIRISPRWRPWSASIFTRFFRAVIIGAITAQSSGCMNTWPAETFLPAASARFSMRVTIKSGNSSITEPARAAANLRTAAFNDADNEFVSEACGFLSPIKADSKASILSASFASNSASTVARSSVSPDSRPATMPSPYPRSYASCAVSKGDIGATRPTS